MEEGGMEGMKGLWTARERKKGWWVANLCGGVERLMMEILMWKKR